MKKYELTNAHRAELKPWADKWIANAMSTKPMDDHDRAQMRVAVRGLYEAAKLTPPPDHRIVFVPSPFVLRFAGGFAAAIWYLRKNKKPATVAATRAATVAATVDATGAATRAATDAATVDATRAANKNFFRFDLSGMQALANIFDIGIFGLQCAQNAYNMWQGGNQWSAWAAFLSFFRYIAKLSIDYSKFDYWEKAAIHGGPRIMHPEFCMISDRPRTLLVDSRNRPHCETGPFCEWSDGSAIFAIEGIYVPEWVVMTAADNLDPKEILKIENVDARRIAIKKIGITKMISSLGAKVIAQKRFEVGGEYRLLSIDFTGSERIYLEMKNPSIGDTHIEAVHPSCGTIDQALGFRRHGMTNLEWQKKNYKYQQPTIIS